MAVMARYGSYDTYGTLWQSWHVTAVMTFTAVMARYVSYDTYGTLRQL